MHFVGILASSVLPGPVFACCLIDCFPFMPGRVRPTCHRPLRSCGGLRCARSSTVPVGVHLLLAVRPLVHVDDLDGSCSMFRRSFVRPWFTSLLKSCTRHKFGISSRFLLCGVLQAPVLRFSSGFFMIWIVLVASPILIVQVFVVVGLAVQLLRSGRAGKRVDRRRGLVPFSPKIPCECIPMPELLDRHPSPFTVACEVPRVTHW